MFFKKLLPLIIAASLFSACSDFSSDNSPAEEKTMTESSSNEVSLKINFDKADERTALPQVDTSSLIYIALRCNFDENTSKILGEWSSEEEMKASSIEFQTGKYKFDLIAMNSGVALYDTRTAEIKAGVNSLSFTPKLQIVDFSNGTGSLNVKISFDGTNVKKVTGGLYDLDGEACPGYNDEELEIASGGECTYSKTGENAINAGNYIVIFKFYADEAKTKQLGSYREYASIAGGLTSVSSCQVSSLASLYNIEYELDGGVFKGSYTAPGNYTRRNPTITLPKAENIAKANNQFGGWYDNQDFNGEAITEIPSGSTGNKKFYAKWLEEATIVFNLNGKGSMDETRKSLTVLKGSIALIPPSSELKIINPTDSYFHGWSIKSSSQTVEYDDWDQITVNENTTLYAVWAVTSIDPKDKTDKKDYDGDGLTDYEEVYIYHTDPSSKDTDGDGWTDYEERELYAENTKMFSPLIADTPDLKVYIIGEPSVSYSYSIGKSDTDTVNESMSGGNTGSSSSSKASTTSESATSQWSEKFGGSKTIGLKSGFEIHGEVGKTNTETNGDSYTYSQSQSEGWSKNWSNGKTKSETRTKTLTAASIKVPIKLKNPSAISYNIRSVTLSISRLANNSVRASGPVATIQKTDIGVLAPGGETGAFDISATLPNTDVGTELEKVLKYSDGLKVEIVGYTITAFKSGSNIANDFTHELTKVKAKTASVYIDCGKDSGRSPELYNVSVKNLYNPHASSLEDLYKPLTLKYIFDNVLNLTENSASGYELTDTGFIKSIHGVSNKSDLKNGAWYVGIKTIKDDKKWMYLYTPHADDHEKLEDIVVKAGDSVSIIYDVDKDEDCLLRNEELLHGTSDDNKDTDGDGLTDYEEIYGWFKSGIGLVDTYSESNKVYTNPRLKDTDGDDYVDYKASSDSTETQDADPMKTKYNTDTSLKSGKYSLDGTNFTSFDVSKVAPDNAFDTVYKDSIYFDIEAKNPLAIIEISTDNVKFVELKKTDKIVPKIGVNNIYVKCKVPNGPSTYAEKVYQYAYKSDFANLSNIQYKFNADGETIFTWDQYIDSRAEMDNSGYVLACSRGGLMMPKYDRSVNAVAQKELKDTDSQTKEIFFVKLSKETLKTGLYKVKLAPDTKYNFTLWAYTGNFNSKSLTWLTDKTTGKSSEATLVFWAHYIEDLEDHDAGYDSRYYWTFQESESIFGLKVLNLDRDSSKDMDVKDEKYWEFGGNDRRDKSNPPIPFSSTSKSFSKNFSRNADHDFTIWFTANERDASTDDDHLGTEKAVFHYDHYSDTWTCKCKISHHGDSKQCYEDNHSYTLGAGQRSENCRMDVRCPENGEVRFRWDWSWDYKEK
ncbi:InlB B-repeat-containing protein [Treponema ruminis]|uniref:Putative repeat protein (TIGR02543 family) n=1 Tax=Treponema ruminis TaxID=744515 RepID=A0A7W8G6X1_9SPIR|nr:InlB B-repeat-containing protein [Treponema ruminis]MBB5224877.1 putative repeat protein (TIGR02543 family) [Treponema ruminis]